MSDVPRKPPEPDDPTVLVGVGLPGGDPDLMAECLVDEYARLGMGDEALLRIFRNPGFTAAYAVSARRGTSGRSATSRRTRSGASRTSTRTPPRRTRATGSA